MEKEKEEYFNEALIFGDEIDLEENKNTKQEVIYCDLSNLDLEEEYARENPTTKLGREIRIAINREKREKKALANERIKKEKSFTKSVKRAVKDKGQYLDTRIRGIDRRVWELFKQHCREESAKRKEHISANKMIIEMISNLVLDDDE